MAFATIGTRGIQAQSVDLTSKVTGTLPVPNGGLGIASGTTGQLLKFTGTETLASSAITTGKVLQIQTAYGGSSTTINTATVQNPINTGFYATITPTTVGNKLIMFGNVDINYSKMGSYQDIGICYSTDGGSNYITTNMGGKAGRSYLTGMSRIEANFIWTTGEFTIASSNEHRISFNGNSGNDSCDFFPNGRASLFVYEVAQ